MYVIQQVVSTPTSLSILYYTGKKFVSPFCSGAKMPKIYSTLSDAQLAHDNMRRRGRIGNFQIVSASSFQSMI